MNELDARRLRVLHAVALRGGVTAAAVSLRVTPSAISQQLAQLEREAGCELVQRTGRGITLTPAGIALAAEAEHVLHALDRAQAAVTATRSVVAGVVRIGAFPSAAGAILAPAAAHAQQLHPGLDVRVTEGEDDETLLDLRQTILDMVIAQEYDHVPATLPDGLNALWIHDDPLHLVTPTAGPYARTTRPALAELRDLPWIAAPPDTPCGRSTRQACRDAGFEPDVRHTALDFALTLDLVAAGLGVALLPELRMRYRPDTVATWPTDPLLKRAIHAITRSGVTRPAVTAVLTELTRYAGSKRKLGPRRCLGCGLVGFGCGSLTLPSGPRFGFTASRCGLAALPKPTTCATC